ncbi:MAG TPA: phospholipid carrier-dependent glycosyltransferase [Armatimonadetes bacterium]|nr:phospholipid carrier-dependent glycosyltransferase [Armatimonadota bacterium]
MSAWKWLAITIIVVGGLVLRLLGIQWGLPDEWHAFSYHPDEVTIALCALSLDIFSLRMNPHFFNYGSLFIYLVYFASLFAQGWGLLNLNVPQAMWLTWWSKLHLIGRVLNAFIGTATIGVVFWASRMAYGDLAALIASFLLALIPLHVQHSHFMTVDVSLAFWTMMSLGYALYAVRIDDAEPRRKPRVIRLLALSGFMGGLAIGTKYGVAVALGFTWIVTVMLVAQTYADKWANGESYRVHIDYKSALKLLSITAVACIVGFLVACPYSILSWHEFIAGVGYEAKHVRTGHGELFMNTGNGHWYHLTVNLPAALGLPLLALALAGVAWAVYQREREDLVLLTFVAVYFVFVGSFKVRFVRYLMPIIPPLAIFAGRLTAVVITQCRPSNIRINCKRFVMWVGAVIALIGIMGYTACYAIAIVRVMMQPDARDVAAEWVRGEIPIGSTIAIANEPWFYTSPVKPLKAGPHAPLLKLPFPTSAHLKEVNYHLKAIWFDLKALQQLQPAGYIISSFEYRELVRLRIPKVLQMLRELERMRNERLLIRRDFYNPFELFGIRFGPSFIPHDMMYTNPVVRVYLFRWRDKYESQ